MYYTNSRLWICLLGYFGCSSYFLLHFLSIYFVVLKKANYFTYKSVQDVECLPQVRLDVTSWGWDSYRIQCVNYSFTP